MWLLPRPASPPASPPPTLPPPASPLASPPPPGLPLPASSPAGLSQPAAGDSAGLAVEKHSFAGSRPEGHRAECGRWAST